MTQVPRPSPARPGRRKVSAMRDEAAADGRTRLAMLSFAALIAFLGVTTYLSLDRAEANPKLRAAFAAATN